MLFVFTFLVCFSMVYKSAYKCTVISFKMLLEMFPLIYYYYNYFGFLFDLYKYYIFCIKVKKYCDVTSQCKPAPRKHSKPYSYRWPFRFLTLCKSSDTHRLVDSHYMQQSVIRQLESQIQKAAQPQFVYGETQKATQDFDTLTKL